MIEKYRIKELLFTIKKQIELKIDFKYQQKFS